MQLPRKKKESCMNSSFIRLIYSFSFVSVLLFFFFSRVSTTTNTSNMKSYSVKLKVYDLSRGMVKTWAPILIGKPIEGIWHTAVLVYDMEYFYGGGILCLNPNDFETEYDIHPVDVIDMGVTQVDQSLFHDYLTSIQKNFTVETYNLVHWNCNNFTNEVCNFLVGKGIPHSILNLPFEVMSTSKGKLILDMMQSYQNVIAPGMEHANSFQNNNTNNKNNKKEMEENKDIDKINSKEKGSFKYNKKLPSVSMDNFFDDQTEGIVELAEIQNFIENENYNSNQKKMFLQHIIEILQSIVNNNNILKNRILLKEGEASPFRKICGIKEVDKILFSLGFLPAFLEIDKTNKTQMYVIFLDPKAKTSFSESLELLLNKSFYLKSTKEHHANNHTSNSNNHEHVPFQETTNIIKLKLSTDCIPFLEKKNGNIKDMFIHISFPYISSCFDDKHEKNDIIGFNMIKNKINVGNLDNEKEKINKMIEWLNKKVNSI